jgi:hypothetical protein
MRLVEHDARGWLDAISQESKRSQGRSALSHGRFILATPRGLMRRSRTLRWSQCRRSAIGYVAADGGAGVDGGKAEEHRRSRGEAANGERVLLAASSYGGRPQRRQSSRATA